ncbi:MAG: DNA-directed RNA polymerase subunit alpha [bacterium]
MQNIALPKTIHYEKSGEQNRSQIIIEPCYPGYGITLGNSVRRVLLSSLQGAAVVGVKIEGISHEFTTLSNLREDILEFVMNLKQLRVKIFTDEIEKLDLKLHGKKEIEAKDISQNSNVEIVNPELSLGAITDMAGLVDAEIYVKKGMGYETVDMREDKRKEIGYIEIDSNYSPIVSVGVNIENVRVGKETNWEKLIIDIKTDGTIEPEVAFENSVKILIEQFSALLQDVEKPKKVDEDIEEDKDEGKDEGKQEEEINTEDAPKKRRGRPKKI